MLKKTFIILGSSFATVNVNIGINVPPPPPPLLLPAPPHEFVIPGTYAYFPPGLDVDIVFYGGYWYRPYQGYWYRSTSYNGKWVYIEEKRLPRHVHDLPPNWQGTPGPPAYSVRSNEKNWRTWERERYWEKHEWKREEKERRREDKEHRNQEKREHKSKKR